MGKKIEIGKVLGIFAVLPEVIALVEAIKAAADGKPPERPGAEVEAIGAALSALVAKVLGIAAPPPAGG